MNGRLPTRLLLGAVIATAACGGRASQQQDVAGDAGDEGSPEGAPPPEEAGPLQEAGLVGDGSTGSGDCPSET
jgi:hypothetical protein